MTSTETSIVKPYSLNVTDIYNIPILIDTNLFYISEDFAKKLLIVQEIIECMGNDITDPIPLYNIELSIFNLICDFYMNEKMEFESYVDHVAGACAGPSTGDVLTQREKEFFKLPYSVIFKLMNSANYVNYKSLLDRTGLFIANIIKEQSPEKLRELFKSQ